MDYRELLNEENAAVKERYDLVMERIAGLEQEQRVAEPFRDYFVKVGAFITLMQSLYEKFDRMPDRRSWVKLFPMEYLMAWNDRLFGQLLPENYENSYANPAYAVRRLGPDYGQLLSFVYTEIRGMIVYAYEGRKTEMTMAAELFMELYSAFEEEALPDYRQLKKTVYWYVSDYSDQTIEAFFKDQFDRRFSFIKDIICSADLSDERYLYLYGAYISDNERTLARYMNRLPEAEISSMAETFVQGFVRGFKVMGMDLSVKKSVAIRAHAGFERVLRKSIEMFEVMGLFVHVFRDPVACINKKAAPYGFVSSSPNPQYDYDHRQDQALYLDKAFNERRLSVLRVLYERHKETLAGYAGPACLQIFGEAPFSPVPKEENLRLCEKQQALSVAYASQSALLASSYMDESNMSFTIIAYPSPAIGKDFEAIFNETVRVNTLDNTLYSRIQQSMIDVLDKADFVRIRGTDGKNKTDLSVRLVPLKDPDAQTKFENCVADVNIPVGEVFTSPVLAGTNGVLYVSSAYLNGYDFKDLTFVLKDGVTVDYSCQNFDTPEENRRYIRENILKNHESLPLGEFAIGTNTTAYAMARKYDIIRRLPILIVEKTGPHFALGDTCYSRSEDHKVYNPDGKEIIARENEISAQRHTAPEQAYFNCHTDITIPYDEIGEISAVLPDGTAVPIIKDGRFVLEGTQTLNEAFD